MTKTCSPRQVAKCDLKLALPIFGLLLMILIKFNIQNVMIVTGCGL